MVNYRPSLLADGSYFFESMFNPLKTIHDTVDGCLLPGTGFITDDNFSTHQRQTAF